MSNSQNTIINIPNYNQKEVISTNNLNDVEDDDTLKLNMNNNNYDINKNDTNNSSLIQTELTTMTDSYSSDLNDNEVINKNIDTSQTNKLKSPIIKEEENHFNSSLLYGNSINDLTPKRIGNMYAFLYINKKPLIIIGPDCKKYIN